MEALIMKGTEDTPEVLMDKEKGIFNISGNCFSDDPIATFTPIFKWITEYSDNPNEETLIEIKLNYVNTASSKQITETLLKFERIKDKSAVKVAWYYDKMDEDMEFEGDTLKSVVKLDFDLIGY